MRPRPIATRALPIRIVALAGACGALLGLVLATATVPPAPRPTAAAFSCGVTTTDWNTIITGGAGCPQ
jgi:H+/gluconate symporter-like permease